MNCSVKASELTKTAVVTAKCKRSCSEARSFPLSSGLDATAPMSTGPSFAHFNRARDAPHYDQVPVGSLRRDDEPTLLEQQSELALSSDPLPPPPLPEQPPVGPEFDPSGSEDNVDTADIKPVHRFIPDSWKNFFRGSSSSKSRSSKPRSVMSENKGGNSSSSGVRCSPPHSPFVPGSYRDPYGGSGGSYGSHKEQALLLHDPLESIDGHTVRTALTYSERVEEYNMRYAYMKSWAGLLRILGCVELLLGAAVFACVCAYVHKDNEWFNMFGYSQPQAFGIYGGSSGSYYAGPQTPFVLVVAGLAWVVTVIVLVLGMTMYYRTILLDSNWWPLTEFVINLVLAVLYMAAGIVYVRDTIRGGLCYYPVFNNGINGAFCRREAGQTAAIIFLFITMLIYLIGAIVCLKLWRHEVARRLRESLGLEMKTTESVPRSLVDGPYKAPKPKQAPSVAVEMEPVAKEMQPEILRGHIPSGHIPKPVVMPDYIQKYPTIRSDEERDQYKAVFNDQYAEYKELHAEVQAVLRKFDEMDALMHSLPQHPGSQKEFDRINRILQEYERKKNDPAFLEKKERCEYLKNKLSHIKQKIQEYDKVMQWNDGYS
ncbi:MARVEL domain-containing protein 2-like isoform X1 [Scleropages formosus]|nr:MARVEL domain-containing protein 2 isoform X1 [Scleropages formosus]